MLLYDENLSYRQQETTFDNPTYGVTFTPTQYSSHGPESPPDDTTDTSAPFTTNTSATPPTYATVNKKTSKKQRVTHSVGNENAEGEYSVLEVGGGEGGRGGGDVVYQVLEDPGVASYEVPIQERASSVATHTASNSATNTAALDEEYSTLKYN